MELKLKMKALQTNLLTGAKEIFRIKHLEMNRLLIRFQNLQLTLTV